MNALAVLDATTEPANPAFAEWVATGRSLLTARTELQWKLADWIADGKRRFGNQVEFDFLADELGIAPKVLKEAARVATAFPPHLRDTALSFQHHESVAMLPAEEALVMLKRAKAEHLDDRETRVEAIRRKAEIQPGYQAEIDWADHHYRDLVRRWNAASLEVRQMLIEQYEESGLSDIEL